MFIYFADRYVRIEHITTFSTVEDWGDAWDQDKSKNGRFSITMTLINGEVLTDETDSRNMVEAISKKLEALIDP